MRCDVLAQGVVDAAKETNLQVPLVVRLAGTNFKEGSEILNKSGLKILSASDLNDAAKKIVEAIHSITPSLSIAPSDARGQLGPAFA